jgi:hypothetical protein
LGRDTGRITPGHHDRRGRRRNNCGIGQGRNAAFGGTGIKAGIDIVEIERRKRLG